MKLRSYFKKHVAITGEHGSWVFLFSPLLIGLFAGKSWVWETGFLVAALLAGFLIRQPIIVVVKILGGRRSKRDLPAAKFWIVVYALFGAIGVLGLIWSGFGFLLILALPGAVVFGWHLYYVFQRAERRQMEIEIIASGVLALAAPAAYWIGKGGIHPRGWWLWLLVWLQSAASIVYAYLRLKQREMGKIPSLVKRWRLGTRAFLYSGFNLVATVGLSIAGILPMWIFLPYLLQWLETVWGIFNPAVGLKPTHIGFRQLAVSSLFTLLFILAWNVF